MVAGMAKHRGCWASIADNGSGVGVVWRIGSSSLIRDTLH